MTVRVNTLELGRLSALPAYVAVIVTLPAVNPWTTMEHFPDERLQLAEPGKMTLAS